MVLIAMRKIVPHVDKAWTSLNTCKQTNDEMSTMTFEDLMSFVGADEYAYAA